MRRQIRRTRANGPGYGHARRSGPARLPAAAVERMSMFSRQALEGADLKQKFLDRGANAWWSSPAEVTAYRASEEKRLGDIIRKAKITLD